AIVPRCGNERDSACQSFEHTDGRNTRKLARVRTTGNMYGQACLGEDRWHAEVGNPAAKLDTRFVQETERFRWISNTVDSGSKPQFPHRIDEELAQFLGAFPVAPVADPDDVQRSPGAGRTRKEHAGVSRLMPGPNATSPAFAPIVLAYGLAEGLHAVKASDVRHCRIGDRTMMRIVKQEQVIMALAMRCDAARQRRRVPLVNQNQ